MFTLIQFIKRHSLIAGLALMFLLTWPIELAKAGKLPFQPPFLVTLFLGWGFIFASLIMTGLTSGTGEMIALLKRFLIWKVSWRWYLVAFLLFPAIFVSAVLLNSLLTKTPVDFSSVYAHKIFGPSASLPIFILPFFLVDAIANGEEIGWRGYVLPKLQAIFNPLVSSLILGLIWGLWHLPKYLEASSTMLFIWFMIKIMFEAQIYTWLSNNTHGSLLLVTILHAAGNTAGMFLPMANTVSGSNLNVLIITIALNFLVVAVILLSGKSSVTGEGVEKTNLQRFVGPHIADP
jgi:membrane protease YdiL (CAAX protease family)